MYGEDGHETQEIKCFRQGTRITGKDLWAMLSQLVSSDPEGLSKLLGVSPDIIGNWVKLIAENREKLNRADDLLAANRRPVMISTGNKH